MSSILYFKVENNLDSCILIVILDVRWFARFGGDTLYFANCKLLYHELLKNILISKHRLFTWLFAWLLPYLKDIFIQIIIC